MSDSAADIQAQLALASDLVQQGRLAEAEAALRAVLAQAPTQQAPHLALGRVLRRQGRPGEAVAAYDAALGLRPSDLDALNGRGVTRLDLGRPAEALADFDAVLAARPGLASVQVNRGLALAALGRHEDALASYDLALAAAPRDPEASYNRGNALAALDRAEAAIASYDVALAAAPNHAEAHANRAAALAGLGRLEPALTGFERAIALRPDHPMLHLGHGNALADLGRPDAAIAAFDRAEGLQPTLATAVYNRAFARLALGHFADGWRDYEQRWQAPDFLAAASKGLPEALRARFDLAVEPSALAGRRVLVVGEQGVGDVIMFAGALPDLIAVAGAVTLVCEGRLHRLFREAFPGIDVRLLRQADVADPAFDHVLPIGSLPRLFRRSAHDFPGRPYLHASPEARARWAERLGPQAGRGRLGVSWRGGVLTTRRAERSVPLEALRPLLDLPGWDAVSLQYGDVGDEIAAANAARNRPVAAFPPDQIDDFDDLAGLVQSLDLVVSVQTAVVHLAGALGVPTLVMTPRRPEWRYAGEAATMPWYGSVTVLRPDAGEAWPDVIGRAARIAAARHPGSRG